ncbi:MAG TPA: substrate-binding domain-containing protein [candidate division Zixibacteria bacterium]|nr:substrate-binding domain-containing protein [candidate division Zixibacteria bacterium]
MSRSAQWGVIVLSIGLLTLGLACGQADNDGKAKSSDGSHVKIGVSLLTRTHPFYQDLEEGLKAAADSAGFELLVTAGEFDVAKQKDQVQDFIVQKVNAIVVSPCDSKSIGTAIQAANEAGIPVFTADIACLAEGAKVISHCASDNYEGGKLAAQAVAEAIGNSGKVAIIDHPEVESVIQRVKGFEDEMAAHEGIEIVAKLTGHGVKDQAFRTAEDVLQAHPDVTAFFGINDDSALGVLAAVEKAGKAGKVKIIGFDAVPEARKAIKEGKIYADVIQQPKLIGQTTIESIKTYLSGGEVSPTVLIPCGLFGQAEAQ